MSETANRALNAALFKMFDQEGEYSRIIEFIKEDDTLEIAFRDERADVYYRGLLIFQLYVDTIKSGEYKGGIIGRPDMEQETEKQVDKLLNVIPNFKQNVDFFHTRKQAKYEREFTQMIFRENNSKKMGNVTDFFLLDIEAEMEFNKEGKVKKVKPDLIGICIKRSERRGREKGIFPFAFIEVKYGNNSYTGDAGIEKHIEDFCNLLNDKEILVAYIEDLKRVFSQRQKLGLIPGLSDNALEIKLKDTPIFVLALIGHNTNSGKDNRTSQDLNAILLNIYEKVSEDVSDNIFIAETSGLGFGLYWDKMKKIREFL